ncbi:60S acidic ribosomal protein P2 [Wickerhamiella sorbophila]|uniref:60S acidic ribosomal protein P2 n=1 Tax=Wickerhamiella sorbophila TaxID=45607 RepID=A0A2T0FHJ7_9ASCO|nr:60S acidic ribosomal protein P2 [Wickerhamiella sorbophila]PRT54472.1 60S acidic ribosomal protein P2 [Wickerhamiella sorbophila]
MKYLAAYLLLNAGGNAAPTAEDIKTVLASVGIEADDERINAVISELSGKSVEDLIAEGSEKLASVPTGGAVAAGGAAAAGGSAAAAAEEEAPAEEEESDGDMGMGLFD